MSVCSTCHWWVKSLAEVKGRRMCVLHTGRYKDDNADLDNKGVIRTLPNFGCIRWRKDERNTS